MHPAIKCLLIPLLALCAQSNLLAQSAASTAEPNSFDLQQDTDFLLQKESELQQALMNLENGGPYSFQATEILSELAQVQQELGNDEEAERIYNELLLNMRIKQGLYNADQIPVVLELVGANLARGEYGIADELGDWAEFLYERAYSADEDLDKLLQGFGELIGIRISASKNHECFELNLNIEDYKHRDYSCTRVRRDRAEHFIAAFQLQKKTVDLYNRQAQKSDIDSLRLKARLAKLSIMTASTVSGTDHMASNSYYDPGISVRRRYDPQYYYNTSFRLIRQLEKDFPLAQLD